MENYRIDKISIVQLEELRSISIETFTDAFGDKNHQADFDGYLQKAFDANQLRNELETPDSYFYFLKNTDEPVGYLKLNTKKAQSDQVLDNAMEVERIYLKRHVQGKGLGTLLLNFAMQEAKNKGLMAIWLGVWEENNKAIAFYKRHGFEVFGSHPFKLGGDLQRDLLMKRLLI